MKKTLVYIDTETTGLSSTAAIIQLAGVIVSEGGSGDLFDAEKQVVPFNFTMRPYEGCTISDEALRVNGRTIEDIRKYDDPRSVKRAFENLLSTRIDKFDKKDKAFFIGYNANFDMDRIRDWFKRENDPYLGSWFWFPPIDIMTIAAKELMGVRDQLPDFRLETVYKAIQPGAPIEDWHDAAADVQATRILAQRFGIE